MCRPRGVDDDRVDMNGNKLILFTDFARERSLPQEVVRALMEATDLGIAVIQDMRVRFTNQQFLDRIGYTRDELEKAFVVELIHPDDVDHLINEYAGVRDGTIDPSSVFEFRVITKDKETIFVEAKVSLIQWGGEQAGLCLFWDIGKRKETEDKLRGEVEKRSEILDGLSERLTHTDTSLRIVWANRAAAESAGLSPDELVGRFCYEVFRHGDRPCEGCPAVETVVTARPAEGRVSYPDNRLRLIRTYPVMGESEIPIGLVIKGVDITGVAVDEPGPGAGRRARPPAILSAPADPNYRYPFSLRIGCPDGRFMIVLGWEEEGREIMLERVSRSEVHSARLLYLAARMKSDGEGWVDKEVIKPGKMDYNLYDLRKSLELSGIPWLDARSARMLIRSRGESSGMIRLAISPEKIAVSPEVAVFRSKKYERLDETTKRIASLENDVTRWPDDEYLAQELEVQRRNHENTKKSIETAESLVAHSLQLLSIPQKNLPR